ncbi:MAG: glycosyltransferase family 2 protein [Candidatus Sericytochromatia bacterium]|nr:glycosyltransferase family 2 protein [Candidatus Tanganyikabacteria bacterium]
MLVSIVIPCYGERAYTDLCVASIRERTGDVPWELILVDNGSPDDTLAWAQGLAAADPRIRPVPLLRNTGFARGVNAGLAVARGDTVCVLNNDAVVTDGWLAGLLRALDASPEIGVVGPMCNYIAGPQRVRDVPYDDDLDEMQEFAAAWRREHTGEILVVPRIVGFCMLLRRAVVDRIGGFDPVFGNGNFEDDDYCLRARIAGFGVAVAGEVFVHHFGSRTFIAMGREADGVDASYKRAISEGWDRFGQKWGFDPDRPFRDPAGTASICFDSPAHRVPLVEPRLYRLGTADPGWIEGVLDYIRTRTQDSPELLIVEAGEDVGGAEAALLAALDRSGDCVARVARVDIDILSKAPRVAADIMNWNLR